MESVLRSSLGKEANSQPYPTAKYIIQSLPTRKPDQRIQVTTEPILQSCLGKESSPSLTELLSARSNPLTSALKQWPHPHRDPKSKPHLSKDTTRWPIQNPKLSWLVKDCFCWSEPVIARRWDYLLKGTDTMQGIRDQEVSGKHDKEFRIILFLRRLAKYKNTDKQN